MKYAETLTGTSCKEDCDSEDCYECPLSEYSGGYSKEYIADLLTGWYPEEEVEKFFKSLIREKLSEKGGENGRPH